MSNAQKSSRGGVATVVLAYAAFAGLWILLSDRVMGLLIADPGTLVWASMLKGWFFVAVTSLLLYGLVRRLANALGQHMRANSCTSANARSRRPC